MVLPQPALLEPLRRWDPEQIGGYALLGRLGAGSMGRVYLGRSAAGRLAATIRPYLLGGLASLSVGAAAIHFAVVFEHFAEYALYGAFFLVISWAQLIWPVVLLWRPSRLWLAGIAGNAVIIAVYAASRTVGRPFGPDLHSPESVGALDVMSCVLEFGLIVGCAALLWRPSLADRPVARGGAVARAAALVAGGGMTDLRLRRDRRT